MANDIGKSNLEGKHLLKEEPDEIAPAQTDQNSPTTKERTRENISPRVGESERKSSSYGTKREPWQNSNSESGDKSDHSVSPPAVQSTPANHQPTGPHQRLKATMDRTSSAWESLRVRAIRMSTRRTYTVLALILSIPIALLLVYDFITVTIVERTNYSSHLLTTHILVNKSVILYKSCI